MLRNQISLAIMIAPDTQPSLFGVVAHDDNGDVPCAVLQVIGLVAYWWPRPDGHVPLSRAGDDREPGHGAAIDIPGERVVSSSAFGCAPVLKAPLTVISTKAEDGSGG
jgi:hypothetical protein